MGLYFYGCRTSSAWIDLGVLDNADRCEAACQAHAACSSWTWHAKTSPGNAMRVPIIRLSMSAVDLQASSLRAAAVGVLERLRLCELCGTVHRACPQSTFPLQLFTLWPQFDRCGLFDRRKVDPRSTKKRLFFIFKMCTMS